MISLLQARHIDVDEVHTRNSLRTVALYAFDSAFPTTTSYTLIREGNVSVGAYVYVIRFSLSSNYYSRIVVLFLLRHVKIVTPRNPNTMYTSISVITLYTHPGVVRSSQALGTSCEVLDY